MNCIRTLSSGKSQIIKNHAFVDLMKGCIPEGSKSIRELFDEMDSAVMNYDKNISTGALSNSHGDWYEWLLAITSWNIFVKNEDADLAILLPNISQFDVAQLYNEQFSSLIDDLRAKVEQTASVQLITSNPDFVIIKRQLAKEIISEITEIKNFNVDTIEFLITIYRVFKAKCNFTDILGYVSVKTSFRPDRRLQIPHEGSLMKAIYTHLQTRNWIINPAGLKYYAIATKINDSDKKALKTVATHSITTVSSLPQAAVDQVFEVNSLEKADEVFYQILI